MTSDVGTSVGTFVLFPVGNVVEAKVTLAAVGVQVGTPAGVLEGAFVFVSIGLGANVSK